MKSKYQIEGSSYNIMILMEKTERFIKRIWYNGKKLLILRVLKAFKSKMGAKSWDLVPISLFGCRSFQTMPGYCYYGQFVFPGCSIPDQRGTLTASSFGLPRFRSVPLEPVGGFGSYDPIPAAVMYSGNRWGFPSVLCPSGQPLNEHLAMIFGVGWA